MCLQKDSERSPLFKYADGVASGKYRAPKLLMALIEVTLTGERLKAVGKKNNGMRYNPELWAFCSTLLAISPQAYRMLRAFLQLPSAKSILYVSFNHQSLT